MLNENRRRLFRRTLAIFLAAGVGWSARAAVAAAQMPPPPARASASSPTLKSIMQALGDEMANATAGLWREDDGAIAAAARRIADHPKVPETQRRMIQAALGAEFPRFARYDHAVHEAAPNSPSRRHCAGPFLCCSRDTTKSSRDAWPATPIFAHA